MKKKKLGRVHTRERSSVRGRYCDSHTHTNARTHTHTNTHTHTYTHTHTHRTKICSGERHTETYFVFNLAPTCGCTHILSHTKKEDTKDTLLFDNVMVPTPATHRRTNFSACVSSERARTTESERESGERESERESERERERERESERERAERMSMCGCV